MITSSYSSPTHRKFILSKKVPPTVTETYSTDRTELLNGDLFEHHMEIQKGDGIHALPWKWSKLSFINPATSRIFATGYKNPSSTGAMYENDIDASGYVRVTNVDLLQVSGISPEMMADIRSTAILKAQANLRKSVASLPLLFLERKATLKTAKNYSKFILNNAITMQRKDVKKWLSALRRRTPKNRLKRLANQIADRHLEFVFGVMPIIDEITESVKHFNQEDVLVRTGRGRDRKVVETVKYSDSTILGAPVTIVTTTIDDYSVRTDLRCDITSKVANNSSLLGFNPLYVLYDNHPLSFIIGWFSNFNTWLASLDPLIGLDYVTGSSSVLHKKTVKREFFLKRKEFKYGGYDYVAQEQSHEHSGSSEDFTREVHKSMPGVQALKLVDKTSLFTYAASVSLLVQRLVKETTNEVHRKPFLTKRRRPTRYLPPINYR